MIEENSIYLQSLLQMQAAHKAGATVLMMIDSQMFDNKVSYSLSDLFKYSHWIVYEGGLTFYNEDGEMVEDFSDVSRLVFQLATWGCNPTASSSLLKKSEISIECFKSTFYGYIICKNE